MSYREARLRALREGVGRDTMHLYRMWVTPECRGRGLGHSMRERAIASARTIDARRIELGVTSGHVPARRLYASLGFEPFGELEQPRRESALRVQEWTLRRPAARQRRIDETVAWRNRCPPTMTA
jgi:ribosomal protein S18 acetylase RimI-like enzyme